MKFSVITSCYNQLEQLKRVREYLDKQTFIDFEWILADDGSSDGTDKWAKKNADKHVFQYDYGYRLTKILNKAAKEAEGEYLVWIMGDSYPHEYFLERIADVIEPDMMVTGIRINVDDNLKIVSDDWRAAAVKGKWDLSQDIIPVAAKSPWKLMTLNSMAMSKKSYERMGGIDSGYDEGYGRMDWDMAAWAYYNGLSLFWVPRAIIYHQEHEAKEDTEHNINLFEKRLEEYANSS